MTFLESSEEEEEEECGDRTKKSDSYNPQQSGKSIKTTNTTHSNRILTKGFDNQSVVFILFFLFLSIQ